MITVICDTWLRPGATAEGLRLTRKLWSDVRAFKGYVSHRILIDQDQPGYIMALAPWRSRRDADAVQEEYRNSETIRQLTVPLARPHDE